MNTQVSLEQAMPLLAESAMVRERLSEQFPGIADDIVSLMQRRDLDNPLGQEVHDFLLDEIENTAEVVWTGLLFGVEYGGYDADDDDEEAEDLEAQEDIDADGDIYPIEIRRYGGVYVVWALESGEEGYFLSFNHAKDYIDWNWPEAIEIRDAAPDYVQALSERAATSPTGCSATCRRSCGSPDRSRARLSTPRTWCRTRWCGRCDRRAASGVRRAS